MDTPTKREITDRAIIDVVSDFPGTPRSVAAFIVRLDESPGRYVHYTSLVNAVEDAAGGENTRRWITNKASGARRAIKGYGRVLNSYGLGYKIVWDGPKSRSR